MITLKDEQKKLYNQEHIKLIRMLMLSTNYTEEEIENQKIILQVIYEYWKTL